jgi:outer membrane protein OmpA-like peptidoglycan-associated protein
VDAQAAQSGSVTTTTAPANTPAAPAAAPATAVAVAPVTTTAVVVPVDDEPKVAWDLLHRHYSTWQGSTGGINLIDGVTGEPGAVRIQLGIDGYSGNDFLRNGDEIDYRGQTLSLSVTPAEVLEVFATLSNRSVNRPQPDGRTLDTLGDFMLGVKVAGHVARTLSVGGDVRAMLGGEVGGSGEAWDATSVALRAALTMNLEELQKPIPLIGRLNVGYIFDNSANLVKDEENRRYRALDNRASKDNETRQLVDRFERLAFGVNRLDKLTLGVGFEAPLQLAKDFFLHPIVEWQMAIPVNRQNYDCPFFEEDSRSGSRVTPNDSCFERHSGTAPMNLLLGVRIVPPLRGLSVLIGVDIGLTGTDRFVRELTPNLPWRFLVALGYDYDARPAPEKIVTVQAPLVAQPLAAPVVATGRIQGVVATAEGAPVAGAIVAFPELVGVTALATGADGAFVTPAFAAGPVALQVTHPDFEIGSCPAAIPPAGGDIGLRCVLVAKPQLGSIDGHITDAWGSPVAGARVALTGAGTSGALLTADADGAVHAPSLTPGEYTVRVEALGYFSRTLKAQVTARAAGRLDATLMKRPSKPSITLRPDSGVDAPAIAFTGESVELSSAGEAAVAELAELLQARPDLNVRIQGYGSVLVARPRAELVKRRLVALGVAEGRIEALGGGKAQAMRILLIP